MAVNLMVWFVEDLKRAALAALSFMPITVRQAYQTSAVLLP
jgi:hypothetical protein